MHKAPSFKTFEKLVRDNPREKNYTVSPSHLGFISEKTWELAREKGIKILPQKNAHSGRPQKYDDEIRNWVYESSKPAKELSKKLKMPLRTVYFIKAGN